MNASPGQPHKLPDYWRWVLTWGAVSRGELDRQEEARGDVFRAACAGAGLVGEVGQERPGGAWTGLWLPSESLPWELGGVGGICSDSTPGKKKIKDQRSDWERGQQRALFPWTRGKTRSGPLGDRLRNWSTS